MQRILAADIAGFNKAYELSNYALAAAVPAAVLSSTDSAMQKAADWTLSLAIPLHMQITTNALVTDYVPTRFRAPVRAAILASSLVTYLGIMKVNLAGPGLTETVKTLWRKQPTPA
ncbi:hypothetical protein OEZ86_006356 [Tetradesmus obliquus]|uniref:Succinate dehydrogenase [ubiquinone] cytochrome b small subunit n=1 Tax=Tetradesmus obliquus TaxID=3088 RepID=A0ABY8TVP0_TETOB|nr:hypothetical protein OEZ85_006667 [Tetradesmus obliquus]WIA33210.1 hypothetical protein OEZ86_006356 [Tetradesmus obliquus]